MKTLNRDIMFFVSFVLIFLFPIVKSQTFDNFWFVQQWPPAVCALQSGRCVGRGTRSFTIHGLWPQKGGNSVTNCAGTPFDFTKVKFIHPKSLIFLIINHASILTKNHFKIKKKFMMLKHIHL